MIGNGRRIRWAKPEKGLVGSPQGLKRLPNIARSRLYRQLAPKVGSQWASVIRDWRPTKIEQFLKYW